jgi:hypothetical protein
MSGLVKDFRCGPGRVESAWHLVGPRWKSSQGGSRGQRFHFYGESALVAIGCSRSDGCFDRILGALAGALERHSAWTVGGIPEERDGLLLIHANTPRLNE